MSAERKQTMTKAGETSYQRWKEGLQADPNYQEVYEEEAAKSNLWLQLVEARQEAGLTQEALAKKLGVSQAQVARLEKRGYDAYTLSSLRRYVQALGGGFQLEVSVRRRGDAREKPAPVMPR